MFDSDQSHESVQKRLRSGIGVYKNNLCICVQTDNAKLPKNKCHIISTCFAWWRFKPPVVLLDDPRVRERINQFIFYYHGWSALHHRYRLKLITNKALTDGKKINNLQYPSYRMNEMFLNEWDVFSPCVWRWYSETMISVYCKNAVRLQKPSNFWPSTDVRSSYMKHRLVRKFDTSPDCTVNFRTTKARVCMTIQLVVHI